MPQINLTEGAIAMLSNGELAPDSDIQPVLQVADIRLVSTTNQSSSERYRILLSDGCFTQQGMLATQRNDLVRSKMLQKGSVVKLTQFVCNLIQGRMIVIIINLDVIVEKCDTIGEPKPFPYKLDGNASLNARPSTTSQTINQPAPGGGNPQSYGGSAPRPNMSGSSFAGDVDSGRYNNANSAPTYQKTEYNSPVSRAPANNYVRPTYQQPPQMFGNRGPIAKNEAPLRIIPIAALNPYQGRWTIKARVTAKAEMRHYNNAKGEGKVFSFDLLDSDGGEIRVTCFNAVADQFYNQIEAGKIFMISKGTLKPASKNFNHLKNEHEIVLDNTSTIQLCFEDDKSIPQQQFHFRSISDIEALENNNVLDVIGVVSSISPSSMIMRKNGTETQKRTLQLKDMSGKSVELTLWGNFCNTEGQTLQNMCDSGIFPVLAVKAGRVSDFNGKSIGTISNSQLLIDPDFPEAQRLKAWFDTEGKSTPAISISRESSMARTDVRKTISQIKDEKLGTSEKPDWITIPATLTFIKVDNFCYTACPVTIGDRQCNKKVIDNGDGKWRCDRCDQIMDECDFRYLLNMQIQDHTGITWVTAFQESGEEIMGTSAKEMYDIKHVEEDDEKFAELIRNVLFTKFVFKLKVKEETFSDEQRVKSTVVKAEKVDFQRETRHLLELIAKFKEDESGSILPKGENVISTSGLRGSQAPAMNYSGIKASQMGGSYSNNNNNQYGSSGISSVGPTTSYLSCNSCGGIGHNAANCPTLLSGPGQSYGSGIKPDRNLMEDFKGTQGMSAGGGPGECYKCHQTGHWVRDCPSTGNVPPAYGSSNVNPGSSSGGGSGECYKCNQPGHWARDCPGTGNVYGSSNVNTTGSAGGGGGSGECYKCHQVGHWARDCPGGASNVPPTYGSSNGRYGIANQRVGGF